VLPEEAFRAAVAPPVRAPEILNRTVGEICYLANEADGYGDLPLR